MSDLMPAPDELVAADVPLSVLITPSANVTRTVRAVDPHVCVVDPTWIPVLSDRGTLTDTSGLLLLVRPLRDSPGSLSIADRLLLTADLDDAGVWARAVNLRARHVVCLPDGLVWLTDTVDAHLHT